MGNKRLNIGVDIDGVLANFLQSAYETMRVMFNGRPDPSLFQTSWAFSSLGITKEEENQLWKTIDVTENWWMNLDPLPNTNLLKPLCDTHRVIFITNRKDANVGWPIEQQSSEWLRRNYQLFFPNVIISDNKGPIAQGLKLDYFIDDRPKNVMEVNYAYPSCYTFLKRDTYNTELQGVLEVPHFDAFAQRILER